MKLVPVWGHLRLADTPTRKNETQMKACDKMCQAAVWLPRDCFLIAFLFCNHKKKKKKIVFIIITAVPFISCGIITRLWKHITLSILGLKWTFPQQRREFRDMHTDRQTRTKKTWMYRLADCWWQKQPDKEWEKRWRWLWMIPCVARYPCFRSLRVQAPAAGTSSPS